MAISCGFQSESRLSRGDSLEHFLSAPVFEPVALSRTRRVQGTAGFLPRPAACDAVRFGIAVIVMETSSTIIR